MKNKIELLSEKLIEEYPEIAMDVLGYSSKLSIMLGWHYLLDIIWILKELDVPPGSTILDAGAGRGVLQFMLVEKGYNVISADMTEARFNASITSLYNIFDVRATQPIEHHYKAHTASPRSYRSLINKILSTPLRDLPRKTYRQVLDFFNNNASSKVDLEIHSNYPTSFDEDIFNDHDIIYYHCNLTKMDKIRDSSIDAVVSVSALEHNSPNETESIMLELDRILKPGGSFYITVSASHPENSFHEPSHSWLLNEKGIEKTYNLGEGYFTNFSEFEKININLTNSKYLQKWLAAVYYKPGQSGMPLGIWEPKYLPVGIKKRRNGTVRTT